MKTLAEYDEWKPEMFISATRRGFRIVKLLPSCIITRTGRFSISV